jgi:ribonuclease T
MNEVFISVDVEASGPIPRDYSLLSIGACNVHDDADAFECLVKPINRNFDAEALKVARLSLDELDRIGLPPAEAMESFRQWIRKTCGQEGHPVFVGFNASFDWSFVNYYFHRYVGENPFGFAALDIKSLYMGAPGVPGTRRDPIASRRG